MIRSIKDLLTDHGHLVGIRERYSPLFGTTWQPDCVEDGCTYRGPHLASLARAEAVAEEHRRKSCGAWRPAK